jgi:hypothetical protein
MVAPRLETKEGFVLLFAASFAPAFIVLDLVTTGQEKEFYWINTVLLAFITTVFVSNFISV